MVLTLEQIAMKLLIPPRNAIISAVKQGSSQNYCRVAMKNNAHNGEFMSKLLDRRWALSSPDTKVNQIMIKDGNRDGLDGDISFNNITQPCLGETVTNPVASFYVVRDDLLHPLVNGNKARKLDALIPLLEDNSVTDVVTCGGCQSAHTAAVAVSCSDRGLKSHLLLRGEEPETLTGYNLVSKLYGTVVYVPRSQYAQREEMLSRYAESIPDQDGPVVWLRDVMKNCFQNHVYVHETSKANSMNNSPGKSRKVAVINEGAGDAIALLGIMRLVQYLSQNHLFGRDQRLKIVVDAGTGTTAVGLALGALCLGFPWDVTAIMLADKVDGYRKKEQMLLSEFLESFTFPGVERALDGVNSANVHWIDRRVPRKFGNILKGEVEECKKIAQQTGILVDPVYTLAAWDLATQLVGRRNDDEDAAKVVMIHTGGTLGMFGLAQRYKSYF